VARQLLPDEFLVVPTIHKHWIIVMKHLAIPAVIVLAIAILVNVVATGPVYTALRTLVMLLLGLVAALWTLVAWLIRLSSSLTLTNQRVIQEEGILRRKSNVIPVDRIQDISINQTVMGRLLGYGDIEIDTAGVVANEVFTYLPQPEELRDQLFVVSAQRRRPSSGDRVDVADGT
jgi:uncharacterized membrane protein YdbT with pleckstrin-like domain